MELETIANSTSQAPSEDIQTRSIVEVSSDSANQHSQRLTNYEFNILTAIPFLIIGYKLALKPMMMRIIERHYEKCREIHI